MRRKMKFAVEQQNISDLYSGVYFSIFVAESGYAEHWFSRYY
jgi:hypothetical protein